VVVWCVCGGGFGAIVAQKQEKSRYVAFKGKKWGYFALKTIFLALPLRKKWLFFGGEKPPEKV